MSTGRELAIRRQAAAAHVDPLEEPSYQWGWHEHFPRAAIVAGIVCGLITLTLIFGHPPNGTELAYIVGTAVILIGLAVRSAVRRRKRWRP